ncbi:peptidyl-tRNA hydrolase ICT1, mitochondrial [Osmia bicornis bicornis]|uniref:peptidyl-tRNA hydrolase ICT1, mitochondrial n=1 Tax=Osmia bicornis bicornis TaxID=1437191 RepID=UPI0010F5A76B|nr:peptidyl-tRNA hydrolase ICT1, mitochondrial [Osmia bicornis bicornis]
MNIANRHWIQILKNDVTNRYLFNTGRSYTYKSAYALDKLYPTSNLKLYTPDFVPENPDAKFNGYIPLKEIEIKYSRSSGPGGQHVNKTNSKVDVRFHLESAKWLSDEVKEKLLELHKTKLSKEGYLSVKSELTRSQQLNLADALEKLRSLIRDAIKPPPEVSPESLELKRKQKLNAARKRLFEKRKQSENKQARRDSVNF